MSNKFERITLWWAECFAALAQDQATEAPGARDAADRLAAAVEMFGEAQDLAAQAMLRFDDFVPEMRETQEMIRRLQGRPPKNTLEPLGESDKGAGIVLVDGETGRCMDCREEVGMGPVGWRQSAEPGPLCNLCLAHSSPDLGALLGVVNHVRRTARQGVEEEDAADAAGRALLDLARRYARASAGGWPLRATEILSEMIEQHQRLLERYGMGYLAEVKRQPGAGSQEPN